MTDGPAEKLRQVCENRGYYTVMDATVTVETEDIDFEFTVTDSRINIVDAGTPWYIERGVERLFVGRNLAQYERPGGKYDVTAVGVALGVGE